MQNKGNSSKVAEGSGVWIKLDALAVDPVLLLFLPSFRSLLLPFALVAWSPARRTKFPLRESRVRTAHAVIDVRARGLSRRDTLVEYAQMRIAVC